MLVLWGLPNYRRMRQRIGNIPVREVYSCLRRQVRLSTSCIHAVQAAVSSGATEGARHAAQRRFVSAV